MEPLGFDIVWQTLHDHDGERMRLTFGPRGSHAGLVSVERRVLDGLHYKPEFRGETLIGVRMDGRYLTGEIGAATKIEVMRNGRYHPAELSAGPAVTRIPPERKVA